ncbi:MAG: hypothetical protein GY930_18510 [bacterium]|nr:hypothetical protein [bacterium]
MAGSHSLRERRHMGLEVHAIRIDYANLEGIGWFENEVSEVSPLWYGTSIVKLRKRSGGNP